MIFTLKIHKFSFDHEFYIPLSILDSVNPLLSAKEHVLKKQIKKQNLEIEEAKKALELQIEERDNAQKQLNLIITTLLLEKTAQSLTKSTT